jgi:hypothetical protein
MELIPCPPPDAFQWAMENSRFALAVIRQVVTHWEDQNHPAVFESFFLEGYHGQEPLTHSDMAKANEHASFIWRNIIDAVGAQCSIKEFDKALVVELDIG